jgi:hypothetical protein
VIKTGSHTTNTFGSAPGDLSSSVLSAEAPRRQVVQVGENIAITRRCPIASLKTRRSSARSSVRSSGPEAARRDAKSESASQAALYCGSSTGGRTTRAEKPSTSRFTRRRPGEHCLALIACAIPIAKATNANPTRYGWALENTVEAPANPAAASSAPVGRQQAVAATIAVTAETEESSVPRDGEVLKPLL